MKGYFERMYEMSQDPVSGETEYFFFGFAVLMCPVGFPLHYIGLIASYVMEGDSDE